jgi:hypothetical protein
MSRRARAALFALLVSVALGASACADMTGPRADCETSQGSNTCE